MNAHYCQTNHHQSLSKQFSRNFIPVSHKKAGSSRKVGNKGQNYYPMKCCSSSISQPPLQQAGEEVELKLHHLHKENFGFVVRDEYGWQVRRMGDSEDEMKKVARVQAEAFHEPVLLFNDLFFEFFQAEVLAGLIHRLRNSPPDRYACLVAEASKEGSEFKEVVGVVDATVYRDNDVLRHLPAAADEYLYISGIAVLHKFRRQKVATALLKACEMVANLWELEYLVLRAYEDDWGARKLYSNAGYRVVSTDPPWTSSWIGRRRRVLMIKTPKHHLYTKY
nr:putative acyl-CoA N-acyltransferase [Ipomoea batatas]